jgi:hypothetical protein
MRPRETELSEFGQYFTDLCTRAGTSPYQIGLLAGITSRSRVAYVLRSASGAHRSGVLPADLLLALARKLKLTQDETTLFMLLGLKEHAPQELRDYISHLERDVVTLRRKLGLPDARFRFKID